MRYISTKIAEAIALDINQDGQLPSLGIEVLQVPAIATGKNPFVVLGRDEKGFYTELY